nr:hypothetical protein [Hallella multisaccharivorax]
MCGLSELTDKPILDPSLFVTVRKQLERYLLPWHLSYHCRHRWRWHCEWCSRSHD